MSIRKYKAEQIVTLLRQGRGLGGASNTDGGLLPKRPDRAGALDSDVVRSTPDGQCYAPVCAGTKTTLPAERLGHRPYKRLAVPGGPRSMNHRYEARRVSTHAHLMAPADARRGPCPTQVMLQSRTAMVWLILACGWLRLYAPEY